MAYKTLEITLISAKGLKNVNLIGKMDVYVVAYLSDDPKNKQKTHVHQDGGTNPSWNYTMRFNIDDANASRSEKYIVFILKHEHTFGADKELGEVIVPLKELLNGVKDLNSPHFVTYQVRRVSSGKPQGELKLSYKLVDMGNNFGTYDKYAQSSSNSSSSLGSSSVPYPPRGYGNVYPQTYQQNTTGYPAPQSHGVPVATGVSYPAPHSHDKPTPVGVPYAPPEGYPHGTGVPYAAPYGYPSYGGYPQHASGGYGYPPSGGYPLSGGYPSYPPQGYMQKPQKPKKNNFGMGLGAGLLGGALGGLVLGEMVDDAFDYDVDF